MSRKYNRSRQRERVLELLQSTGSHPTADWIYQQLKKEMPELSMATVYRNLNILKEQELIREIDFGSARNRFEARTGPHYHFICEQCGAIRDLDLPIDHALNERVNQATPLVARRHRIEFYGICDLCTRRNDR